MYTIELTEGPGWDARTLQARAIKTTVDIAKVELRGFGAFSVKQRDARMGRNPRTGGRVHVDEKHIPYFKTGKQLRDRLNH